MSKVRLTITLTQSERDMLDDIYVSFIKKGAKQSYSDIVGDAIASYYDDVDMGSREKREKK